MALPSRAPAGCSIPSRPELLPRLRARLGDIADAWEPYVRGTKKRRRRSGRFYRQLKTLHVHRHRHDGQTHCAQASPTGMACLQRLRHCSAVAMAAARAAKRLWSGLACRHTLANLVRRDTLADLACRDTLVSREARISSSRSGAPSLQDSCVLLRNNQTITISAWGEARRLAARESLH